MEEEVGASEVEVEHVHEAASAEGDPSWPVWSSHGCGHELLPFRWWRRWWRWCSIVGASSSQLLPPAPGWLRGRGQHLLACDCASFNSVLCSATAAFGLQRDPTLER